jgi:hypothetical protein
MDNRKEENTLGRIGWLILRSLENGASVSHGPRGWEAALVIDDCVIEWMLETGLARRIECGRRLILTETARTGLQHAVAAGDASAYGTDPKGSGEIS